MGFLRNWACSVYSIKDRNHVLLKFRNRTDEPFELIEDLTKSVEYYNLHTGCEFLVDCKDHLQSNDSDKDKIENELDDNKENEIN